MDLTKKFSKNLMFSLFLETCPTSPGPSGIADYQIAFGGETRTRETHRYHWGRRSRMEDRLNSCMSIFIVVSLRCTPLWPFATVQLQTLPTRLLSFTYL